MQYKNTLKIEIDH